MATRGDTIELKVFDCVARLKVARYADLCRELSPLTKKNLSQALMRLRDGRFIRRRRDSHGDYDEIRPGAIAPRFNLDDHLVKARAARKWAKKGKT